MQEQRTARVPHHVSRLPHDVIMRPLAGMVGNITLVPVGLTSPQPLLTIQQHEPLQHREPPLSLNTRQNHNEAASSAAFPNADLVVHTGDSNCGMYRGYHTWRQSCSSASSAYERQQSTGPESIENAMRVASGDNAVEGLNEQGLCENWNDEGRNWVEIAESLKRSQGVVFNGRLCQGVIPTEQHD